MFWNNKKIDNNKDLISDKLLINSVNIKELEGEMRTIRQEIASLKGLINRKIGYVNKDDDESNIKSDPFDRVRGII